MSFWVEHQARGDSPIWYETDEVKICVGQIGKDGGDYRLHHGDGARNLKEPFKAGLKAFAEEQILLLNIIKRLKA